MEKFINDLGKTIGRIVDDNDEKNIQQKYEIETDCLKFIKMKGKKFFIIYFNLAKENKLNLKYFIETELDEYYKKYETHNYNLFKSFQKFQLNELNKYQKKLSNCGNFREMKQTEYMNEIKTQLELTNKCFIKAPTGFGKTVLYYKSIGKLGCKKILILTPRKMLNKQIVETKYIKYLYENNNDYKILHYSELSNVEAKQLCIKKIKKYQKKNSNFILTSCYQSKENLLSHIQEFRVKFDLIIFDEAHTIETWENSPFVLDLSITKYRIFGSATPTENIESKPEIFGSVVEKVKVYELINNETLCNIITLVKKLNGKKQQYHNLRDLVVESMEKYNKRKGIIYVNSIDNAQKLYDLMKTQSKINTYIFVSGIVKVNNDDDLSIEKFEADNKASVIIAVGKISYGYDNPLIDFICLGDPRQSDIDIRQILGRGLRWNKEVYPNKILHILIPLYRNEFGKYNKNEALKKYLDYIIGECGKDIIIKNTNIVDDFDEEKEIMGNNIGSKDYNGLTIPIDILQEYCTTGYNKFTDFMRFLKINNCWDEESYNELWENNKNWMCDIGRLKDKYPKFTFQQIHPLKNKYYETKEEAKEGIKKATIKLVEIEGKDKVKKYNNQIRLKKIIEIDNQIPYTNLELYY